MERWNKNRKTLKKKYLYLISSTIILALFHLTYYFPNIYFSFTLSHFLLDLPFPHLFFFYLVFFSSSQFSLLIYLLTFSRKWLLTLCNPMDCSLTGSSVHGIFQARVLEWITISFSRGSSWPRNRTQVSHIAGRCFTIWATKEAPYTKSNGP